jgi:hypothetical protein
MNPPMWGQPKNKPINWVRLIPRLSEAPDSFMQGAARIYTTQQEMRELEKKLGIYQRPTTGMESAYNAAEGCIEFEYHATRLPFVGTVNAEGTLCHWDSRWESTRGRAPYGTMRVPESGPWMYVCAVDLYGEKHYWRHKRVEPGLMFSGEATRDYATGSVVPHDWEPDWAAKLYSPYQFHTVEECEMALRKHQPDKGGDPERALIWTARLDKARQLETGAAK